MQFISMADITKALEASRTALAVNNKVIPQSAPFAQQFRMVPCNYPNPDSPTAYFMEMVQDNRLIVLPATPGDTLLTVGFR